MSHPSRMKNPDLPSPHVATSPAADRSCVLIDFHKSRISLVTAASFFLAYAGLGFTTSQLGLTVNCHMLVVLHILIVLCMLSLIDHCHIRLLPP